jgi:hypothetical protein
MKHGCEYAGCDGYTEPHEGGMDLCFTHEQEFARASREGPAAMLAFWIRAKGDAKELAQVIAEERLGPDA